MRRRRYRTAYRHVVQSAETLPLPGPGEHVCWLVHARDEYVRGQRALIADGTSAGDNILIIGAWNGSRTRTGSGAVATFDPRGIQERGQAAVLRAVRRAERAAGREGRALRVLAQMEAIAAPGEALEDLVARELRFGELTSGGVVSVVCAYRQDAWDATVLGDLTAVHPRHVGARQPSVGFRMTYAGPGCWALRGAIDFDGIRAFAAVLRASMARTGQVRLLCHELDLMDAAALRTLVEAVHETPGGAVRVEGANDTVLKAWQLSGYGAMDVRVRVEP
jgi:hypothetical protein